MYIIYNELSLGLTVHDDDDDENYAINSMTV